MILLRHLSMIRDMTVALFWYVLRCLQVGGGGGGTTEEGRFDAKNVHRKKKLT